MNESGWFTKKVMQRGAQAVVEDVDLVMWLEKVWGSVWLRGSGREQTDYFESRL